MQASQSAVTANTVADSGGQLRTLLFSVFIAFLAQMSLNPIIAPLAREVGLAEWQIGATIGVAAVMVVAMSPIWGRKSQSAGRKRVLLVAYGIALTAMILFAVVSQLGMAGVIGGAALFALFIVLRGIGFGTAIAAIMPTAQAYVSDITPNESARVRGMAGLGAAQGMAMIAGAAVGGLLGGFGLIWPLIAVPALLCLGLVTIALKLQQPPSSELIREPARLSAFDSRVWPYLAAGFGLFTGLGFIQVVTGFLVQDRFGLDAETTAIATGGALLLSGVGIVFSQAAIVPKSGWSPTVLLRVGAPLIAAGFFLFAFDLGVVTFAVAMLIIGISFGIAVPGYTAGPTLRVRREEQGALAGLIGATNGLTFVVSPALGAWLYGVWQPLPVLVGAAILTLVAVFVFLHPQFRRPATVRPSRSASE